MTPQEKARAIRPLIEKAASSLDDADALNGVEMFPAWSGSARYNVDNRVRYNGVLYRCLQDHDSQDEWTPTSAVSLWAKVLIPDPEVIPEWEQPDSTNPYMTGDKVTHNGKTWVSLVDNNVWEPGAVGTEALWSEVT